MMPDTLIRNAEEMHTKIAPTPRGLDLCETLAADFLGPFIMEVRWDEFRIGKPWVPV